VRGGSAYRVDSGKEIDPCPKNCKQLREDGIGEKIWRHTIDAFEEIETERMFSG
jgi:hypothetical protein